MIALFWILGIALVASAIWVVTATKPIYSVVGLLLHFAALAIFYFSLSAEFLAVVQIIVYSGAILILFLFVIALLSSGTAAFSIGPDKMPKASIPAAIFVIAGLGFLIYGVSRLTFAPVARVVTSPAGPVGTADVFGSVNDFGRALFTTNLLPFEITAFILMVAVIGVVLLAGDATPYVPTRRRARLVEREMHDAIVRAGEE
ncbi:MAG: NADH-quinone oxidoreductase subunit J [Candidatus Eremiobacteraeota bacterium]|nr:NADH-quinone oxidoreductase subunit J [Candidatus Eremiobacteraeota bacterium]